jgi:arylsulfatase
VPNLRGRSHTITADVEVPAGGAEGVIIADGGRYGGFSLYIKDGKPVYEVNAYSHSAAKLVSDAPLPTGKVHIEVAVTADPLKNASDRTPGRVIASGTARLSVNGKQVAEGPIANFISVYGETLDVGKDLGSPVSPAYESPFAFTGTINTVALDLK